MKKSYLNTFFSVDNGAIDALETIESTAQNHLNDSANLDDQENITDDHTAEMSMIVVDVDNAVSFINETCDYAVRFIFVKMYKNDYAVRFISMKMYKNKNDKERFSLRYEC